MPDPESPEKLPSVDALQFQRAEHIPDPGGRTCAACNQPIVGPYFQVQNHVVCPQCAAQIEAGKQNRKKVSLLRPAIYGAGAALAGCALYAIVLAMGVQIGIVALAVGWMVGKAIRHASYGLGGRPQQILAVALTYFAISTSYIPVLIYVDAKQGTEEAKQHPVTPPIVKPAVSPGKLVGAVLILAAVSPFLELKSSPVGALISLFILFVGLQRAWAMTARHEILLSGPYS